MKSKLYNKTKIVFKTLWEFNVAIVATLVLYYLSYSIYNTSSTWNYSTKEYILISIFSFVFFLGASAYFIYIAKQYISHIKFKFDELNEKDNENRR